jgi:MFS family permease
VSGDAPPPGGTPAFRIPPEARRLIMMRAGRSLGQGAMVVDLALYLARLGWSGVAIGGVLTAGGLLSGTLALFVGPASDRLRRRPFLVGNEIVTVLCGLTAFLTRDPLLLVPAIVLASFGRGANGSAGPFTPAEQAWLATLVPFAARGRVYSLNVAVGFFGMATGALLAVLPGVVPDPLFGYRLLFLVPALGSAFNLFLLARTHEPSRAAARAERAARAESEPPHLRRKRRRRENRHLGRLVALNALNGFAIGLIGPLMPYWFHLRFGVGPSAIAPAMAVVFAITAVASLLTARLTERIGLVNSVVKLRLIGLVLLVLLPLVPWYPLAALLYVLRSAANRSSVGARQAVVVSLVEDERRGFAVSLNAASFVLPQALGPTFGGYFLDGGMLVLPFYIAAVLQGAYVWGYWRSFRTIEQQATRAA